MFAGEKLVFNRAAHGALLEETISVGSGPAYFEGKSMSPADVEARGWLASLIEDKPVLVEPRQALVTTQILEAIYTSAKSGKAVYL